MVKSNSKESERSTPAEIAQTSTSAGLDIGIWGVNLGFGIARGVIGAGSAFAPRGVQALDSILAGAQGTATSSIEFSRAVSSRAIDSADSATRAAASIPPSESMGSPAPASDLDLKEYFQLRLENEIILYKKLHPTRSFADYISDCYPENATRREDGTIELDERVMGHSWRGAWVSLTADDVPHDIPDAPPVPPTPLAHPSRARPALVADSAAVLATVSQAAAAPSQGEEVPMGVAVPEEALAAAPAAAPVEAAAAPSEAAEPQASPLAAEGEAAGEAAEALAHLKLSELRQRLAAAGVDGAAVDEALDEAAETGSNPKQALVALLQTRSRPRAPPPSERLAALDLD